MKTIFLLFCGLCATAAFGQNVGSAASVLNAEPAPIAVTSHPAHATQKAMLSEQSLLGTSSFTYAHGERPLWEVAPKKVEVPLGDVARTYRKEHAVSKKSATVVEP
jgi:hypothetical protein